MKQKADAADAQAEQNRQIEQEAEENHAERVAQLQLQNLQDEEAVGEEVAEQREKQAQAEARMRLSAMEASTSGNSVDALFRQYKGQGAEYQADKMENLEARQTARERKMDLSGERAVSRARQMQQPVSPPNFAAGALKIGQSAVSAYDQYSGPDGDFGIGNGSTKNNPRVRSQSAAG
jgi:putative component of toxin-antitoxin plasmid stabilization module